MDLLPAFQTLKKLLALDAEATPGYLRLGIIGGLASAPQGMLDIVGAEDAPCSFPPLAIPGRILTLPDRSVTDGGAFARLEVPLGIDLISEHLVDAYRGKLRRAIEMLAD